MTDMTNAPKPMKWSGGEHVFTLNHPWVRNVLSIRGLPGDFGNTPSACYKRFAADLYSSDDIERVLYLSLVGGGLSLNDAESLIQRFVRTQPVLQNAVTAMLALQTYFADASDTLAEAA